MKKDKIERINVDFKELKTEKEKNFAERLRFIDSWVNFIKKHSDEEWSEQQNVLINSQLKKN
jgi:hypothetical protein